MFIYSFFITVAMLSNDPEYVETLHKVADAIKNAEYILVGGAAGMSAAGSVDTYGINDPIYLKNFKDIEEKYHAGSIWRAYYLREYTGRDWESREDHWGFKITLMHFDLHDPIHQPYINLKNILKGKEFDIVTTNQDVQFPRAFPDKDVAVIQGDWRYLQCSKCCHDKVYESVDLCDELFPKIVKGSLPKELIPRCPKCGAEMIEWVRGFEFLQGSFYHQQYEKYHKYMDISRTKRSVYLELGVGVMTPMFIKEPFINLAYENPNSTYIPINPKHAIIPNEIKDRSIKVPYDIAVFLADLESIM